MANTVRRWKELMRFRETLPVAVELLPSALGIELKYAPLSSDISGMLENNDGKFTITINEKHAETRKRFTLAHEIGHFMLHRELVGDGLDDDKAYRSSEAGKYNNKRIGMKEETEANKFAANLLMPVELVRLEWDKRGNSAEDSVIEDMAKLFKVSKQTMAIRLGKA